MTIPVSDGFPLFRLPFANDRKRQAAFFLNIFAWVLTTVAVIASMAAILVHEQRELGLYVLEKE